MASQERNFAKANTREQCNPSDLDPLWIVSYKDLDDETSCANRCSRGILFLMKGGYSMGIPEGFCLYVRIIVVSSWPAQLGLSYV